MRADYALFNTNIELISSWGIHETGDPQWRVLGLKHSLRTADWMINADGSVVQSVHYNPGDNRQEFTSGNTLTSFPNHAEPHQAWAVYGFTATGEGVHFRNRDTSAAAILAGGMLQLSASTKDPSQAALYHREGQQITPTLSGRYLSGDGVLRHGCGIRPHDGELVYGNYYLLETLTRLIQ
jgi:hypothetical protein